MFFSWLLSFWCVVVCVFAYFFPFVELGKGEKCIWVAANVNYK